MDQRKQAGRDLRDVKEQEKTSRIFSRIERLQAVRTGVENMPAGVAMELPEMAWEDPERWDGMS